ncbi:MAG: 2-oxo acid dehydrogenase subunit E2 [Bifidobacteriaceae bacterium]|jgi:pyruvate dehydrogenase E2 component (dihydrolipoamide acetyltransferase)|nr:2-oxo acid dehydrogenase subunit E2 [Bifidobacteriaceae bacterium]
MIEITMPRLSDTMEEGAIASWQVSPGDDVSPGDVLAEVETDKAVMDFEAYDSGRIDRLLVEPGAVVAIGQPIALLDDGSGEAPSESGSGALSGESAAPPVVGARGGEARELGSGEAPRVEGMGSSSSSGSGSGEAGAGTRTESGVGAGALSSDTLSDAVGSSSPGTSPGLETAGSPPQSSPDTGWCQAPTRVPPTPAPQSRSPKVDTGTPLTGAPPDNRLPHNIPAGPVLASPLVRRMARDHDLDLRRIAGSGPGGRVIRLDVERALESQNLVAADSRAAEVGTAAGAGAAVTPNLTGAGLGGASGAGGAASSTGKTAMSGDDPRAPVEVPVSALRRVIARRLTEAAREIPVFTVTLPVRADALLGLRKEMNAHLAAAGRGKVSVNDLVVKAAALALRQYPAVNASWAEDRILMHGRVNVGIAVATERGLMVPVIPDADLKTPTGIGAEARSLAGLAAESKLAPEQMSGGTFTVSNLGMYGVEQFTAIINPPEAAIVAVGAARPELALEGADVVSHQVMRLTLSCDHRLIDGALGAQFLTAMRELLENPWSLVA